MAHHVYQTEGYILGTSPSGEAGLYIRIYTKDLGLIHATAQGARYLKSKLRYSLQEFSYSKLSLVRGKELWRITNAREEHSLHAVLKEKPETFAMVARILALLNRLISGEEEHAELFQTVHSAFDFFIKTELSKDEVRLAEYILVLKIIQLLGYGSESLLLNQFVSAPWTLELIRTMDKHKVEAVTHIRQSVRESHL